MKHLGFIDSLIKRVLFATHFDAFEADFINLWRQIAAT
jgi:hypothetical protein